MNKTEFLLALQKQISMLEDDEQKDIIDEYSQHIDMKVQNGMTEDEAIEEFGPLDQLVGEILGAYHVKAPSPNASEKTADQAFFGSGNVKAPKAEKIIEGGKQAAANAAQATKKGASKIKEATGNLLGKTKEGAAKAGEKTKEAVGSTAGSVKKGAGHVVSGVAKGTGALGSGIIHVTMTCIRWCWNILVACACATFLLFALVCLFTLGFCIVLQIQGYPLLGICLCALGLLLACLSLMLLCAKLIRRKRADETQSHTPAVQGAAPYYPAPAAHSPAAPQTSGPTAVPTAPASVTRPISPLTSSNSTEPLSPVR
ncbi:MAG: DUF1700 domain-containing protein [Eggerthellaceae bacterium]|nr:DUF1700 domain-containing protein [Eggerthellaceae bacterium]